MIITKIEPLISEGIEATRLYYSEAPAEWGEPSGNCVLPFPVLEAYAYVALMTWVEGTSVAQGEG